jgi:hypothetical protein
MGIKSISDRKTQGKSVLGSMDLEQKEEGWGYDPHFSPQHLHLPHLSESSPTLTYNLHVCQQLS